MLYLALLITLCVAAGLMVLARAVGQAGDGHEDDAGFHPAAAGPGAALPPAGRPPAVPAA